MTVIIEIIARWEAEEESKSLDYCAQAGQKSKSGSRAEPHFSQLDPPSKSLRFCCWGGPLDLPFAQQELMDQYDLLAPYTDS